MACWVKGIRCKMTGDQCSITYEMVCSHMKNIYDKLHVANMNEVVGKVINQLIVIS